MLLILSVNQIFSQVKSENDYPKSMASYADFKKLVEEVELFRSQRLVNLNTFLKMSKEENTIILDTRSKFRYNRKHLKGAVHLNFSDFTQEDLRNVIPDFQTRVLIYCNNNFSGDQIEFMTKKVDVLPSKDKAKKTNPKPQFSSQKKPIMLALNIPTLINLYGYGYRNVYELNELIDIQDSRIEFEGTEVKGKHQ